MPRPFRFGVVVNSLPTRAELEAMAKRAESMGYATLLFGDHLGELNSAVLSALVAADATSKLRVGSCVLANDLRNPVVLAKDLATLDAFTGGRLEIGLGSGWLRSDYEGSGIPFEAGATRVDRLKESVAILKALLAGKTVSFQGVHYHVQAQEGYPKPVQIPHPPLLIGGGAIPLLRFAAREADIVSINPRHRGGTRGGGAELTAATVAAKVHAIREAAGSSFAEKELNLCPRWVIITEDIEAVLPKIAERAGLSIEETRDAPYVLIGKVKAVADRLLTLRETYGISYFVVVPGQMERLAPVIEQLAAA